MWKHTSALASLSYRAEVVIHVSGSRDNVILACAVICARPIVMVIRKCFCCGVLSSAFQVGLQLRDSRLFFHPFQRHVVSAFAGFHIDLNIYSYLADFLCFCFSSLNDTECETYNSFLVTRY